MLYIIFLFFQGIWKSPDDELLTLAATDGAIIVMTARDLEPLLEFQPEGQAHNIFSRIFQIRI